MTLGIIDLGTNSIHLVIGVLGLNGKFHVVVKERELAYVGESGLVKNRLSRAAIKRAMAVLKRYATILRRYGAEHVEAVATSAVREAKNGRQFVRRVRRDLQLPLRTISGREEARLIYLGTLQEGDAIASGSRRSETLMVTIGGGSAQVICGNRRLLYYACSVPLGGARLAQRFIRHDPARPAEMNVLYAYVSRLWSRVARDVKRYPWQQAFGNSATIYQLMMAAYLRRHSRPPKQKDRLSLSRRSLRELVSWLSTSTASRRRKLPGLDPKREAIALTTGVTLLAWMECCDVSTLRCASGSLREGLVRDYLIRYRQREYRRIAQRPHGHVTGNGVHRPSGRVRRRLESSIKRDTGTH